MRKFIAFATNSNLKKSTSFSMENINEFLEKSFGTKNILVTTPFSAPKKA